MCTSGDQLGDKNYKEELYHTQRRIITNSNII